MLLAVPLLALGVGAAHAQQAPALPEAPAVLAQPPASQPPAPPEAIAPAPPTSLPDAEAVPAPSTDAAAPPPDAVAPVEDGSAEATLPRDLSPWGMFQAADVVVKAVMLGLVFASLVTWTVWIAKSLEIVFARARLRRGLAIILGAPDLAAAGQAFADRSGPAALMVRAARSEAANSVAALDSAGGQGLLARVTSHLSRIEAQAGRRLAVGTGVLATIGATAPFVGLFGTVWGIMNSFIGISESQTTNLAVVAPGIAEALLATALGLVAAIPAVVIYNVFARSTAGYRALLADAAAGVERLVSRDLDHQRLEAAVMRAAAE